MVQNIYFLPKIIDRCLIVFGSIQQNSVSQKQGYSRLTSSILDIVHSSKQFRELRKYILWLLILDLQSGDNPAPIWQCLILYKLSLVCPF
ncbi:UNKNOWN [Stylonychia lemnae]|uniref:Uncharacterized protein n=1 Tax=Stylonychia lemnae TaxID=5949 RepID=A0A078A6Y2_STYLE|nr:UNKNOWN [Stylonychia lemnae]|eukprot:CDW78015.1 UNKNOWN [Stylonychia lemnae]